ncbi:glycosyltransferase family 4 protein [Candidatus Peregrinibacteria bacterium]|nr:glycosyltransferase family 4 protein [Candidatus Peregrinibacteria bacterium]
MKNILFYTDTPIYGGAERQMVLLAKFLDAARYNISLACSAQKSIDALAENFERLGKKVFRISALHKHDPRHYFQLRRAIKESNAHLIHAHVWNPASCRYAYLAARSAKIPLVITEHDPGKISTLKNIIKKYLLKNVSAIIAISEENKKFLSAAYSHMADKITVVHNGIDIDEFENRLANFVDREKYRKEVFGASQHNKIILCVAELHPRKGIKYLIQAFAKISDVKTGTVLDREPSPILVVVGNGKQTRQLEELAKNLGIKSYVKFLGQRNNVPELMASADLFVLPSLHEAFGLVLLEAGAAKLPVISTNSGGVPEIIENNHNGLLVPPANADALAKAIKNLLAHPDLNKKFTQAGYGIVKEKFDAKIMAEKTSAVYDKLLKS